MDIILYALKLLIHVTLQVVAQIKYWQLLSFHAFELCFDTNRYQRKKIPETIDGGKNLYDIFVFSEIYSLLIL